MSIDPVSKTDQKVLSDRTNSDCSTEKKNAQKLQQLIPTHYAYAI